MNSILVSVFSERNRSTKEINSLSDTNRQGEYIEHIFSRGDYFGDLGTRFTTFIVGYNYCSLHVLTLLYM